MGIVDFWNNPLSPATLSLIGYRGSPSDFSHDIYSFLLSSFRESDQKETALVWRFLQPMQEMWEAMYASFFSVFELLSPEDCPTEYLDYLRKQVGILDDLGFVWNELTEGEKRKFIRYFVRFCEFRGTDLGLVELLQTMTGQVITIREFFDYRWIISGDLSTQTETALGREEDSYDPWMISEADIPVGIYPDSVTLVPSGTEYFYRFVVNTLISRNNNPPVGEKIIVRYAAKGFWYKTPLKFDGTDYFIELEVGEYFGQTIQTLPQSPYMFLVGGEPDPYVSDILIEDREGLSHAAVKALVRFARPLSERIYIRYYNILEYFSTLDRWTLESGLASLVDGEVTLGDTSATVLVCNHEGSDAWANYCVGFRIQSQIEGKSTDLLFMRQSSSDCYYVRLSANAAGTLPAGVWELRKIVGGFDTLIANGNLDTFDLNVSYYFRIECFLSSKLVLGVWEDIQLFRFYQDEVEIYDGFEFPPSWGGGIGTVGVKVEADGEAILSRVYVHPLPMESDLVALN